MLRLIGGAVAVVGLMFGTATASAQSTPTLYFSAIPDDDETRLMERFGNVAAYLSEQLGVPVEYVPVKSYAASVTAFRNDQIQLAWFGGLSGVQARLAVPGSQALAQGDEDMKFISYFIAHESTGLERSEDFPAEAKGLSFTFGAQTSTSGRLFPEFYIREETGEAPDDFFSRVGFSGDHGQTLRLVATGAFQVGALNYTVYDTAVAEGAPEAETTRIIWQTPPYPDYNWTIRGDADERFGEGFSERVKAALIGMDDPELLASFPRAAFVEASNEDYAPIEETGRALGILD
ncbi:putative selenate ABC transporter substrate-binding protein [Mesorhizobium microcysteis]|uniref:Putative selenate ABC transporter substrate-binding protein n=1 Tax=Neoaquamicrobium microcysteis TaxID=2682781 RepID=A0A5D4GXZ2_9HYPH|nr:putative selenate ABC transporter substrate-binding protein [Mesorhizobium microcysteis]TYR32729.1 putative selenate ABC transporter substrate-binding protein [Mesorhizobium microcysteis]